LSIGAQIDQVQMAVSELLEMTIETQDPPFQTLAVEDTAFDLQRQEVDRLDVITMAGRSTIAGMMIL
jgi:hypothetical protein